MSPLDDVAVAPGTSGGGRMCNAINGERVSEPTSGAAAERSGEPSSDISLLESAAAVDWIVAAIDAIAASPEGGLAPCTDAAAVIICLYCCNTSSRGSFSVLRSGSDVNGARAAETIVEGFGLLRLLGGV